MYSVCLSENKSSQHVFVKRGVSVCLSKNGSSLWLKCAICVLGADNVPPAKPARPLSAHVSLE